MKKIFIIVFFSVMCISVHAQVARFAFFSAGFSFLTDLHVTPSNLLDTTDATYGGTPCQESFQSVQWNFVSGIFSVRCMLIPMTENSSFSLSASPTISVGAIYPVHNLGSRYGMNVTIPAYIEFNYGAASRYVASKDWGVTLGIGGEYYLGPLLSYALSDSEYENSDFMQSTFSPSCKLGFRYWSKKNKVNEIILKLGFGKKGKEFYTFGKQLSTESRPMHIGLSFLRILNY